MTKKILLDPQKNKFVQYDKYEGGVAVPVEILYLLKELSTHKEVCEAATGLYEFFTKVTGRGYDFSNIKVSEVTDFTNPINENVITINYINNYDHYTYKSDERRRQGASYVAHNNDREYLNETLHNRLENTTAYPDLNVKLARVTDISKLTDNTGCLVTKKFSNKKFNKIITFLDCVEKYIETHDFKQLNYLKVGNAKCSIMALTHYKNEVVIQKFKDISKELKVHFNKILQREIDFSRFIEHTWNGNLESENVIDNKKSYYIIAREKYGKNSEDEGFIGLKSVYNRSHSNSYTFTVVKDLKNALLFTDDNIYDIGYFEVLDKMYIAGDALKIENAKSKLAQRINVFLEKKSMTDSLSVPEKLSEESIKKPSRVSKL